ncbi:MAG: PorP/SprF family type IX secretion system membrane protein [Flavobacteriales bacterium]|nr:PorP/SprF family type IX secretion system membrane protein [Flavobacteriales bacterium]
MGSAFGQDAQFTQFYAQPTYLSPAFAGTSLQSRFGLTFRDQWPSIPGAFMTYNAAWDHYMSNLNSGVGLLVTHDRAGSGALRYTSIAAQYAYEIELKRKVFIRPALQFGFVQHAVDLSKLTFGDQLARGGDLSSYEHANARSIRYGDMGAGCALLHAQALVGHWPAPFERTEPIVAPERIKGAEQVQHAWRLPVSFAFTGDQKHPESIVAAFNFKSQGKYDQLDLGAYYEREPFYAGLWYRGHPHVQILCARRAEQ